MPYLGAPAQEALLEAIDRRAPAGSSLVFDQVAGGDVGELSRRAGIDMEELLAGTGGTDGLAASASRAGLDRGGRSRGSRGRPPRARPGRPVRPGGRRAALAAHPLRQGYAAGSMIRTSTGASSAKVSASCRLPMCSPQCIGTATRGWIRRAASAASLAVIT